MKAILAKKVYTMAGAPLENGVILVEEGKILKAGEGLPVPEGAEVVDWSEFTVTPGFIDAHTHLGGFGIKCEDSSNEMSDPICPQMRIVDGVNPLHESFAKSRQGGFTSCCLLPGSANLIGGVGAIVKLDGKIDIRKSVIGPPQIKMALGENPRRAYGADKGRPPITRMGNAALLREALRQAEEYDRKMTKGEEADYDPRWEALRPAFHREAVVHVHCHRMDDILTAIRLLEPYGMRFTIDHATEGHLVADILAEKQVKCIVGPISCGPQKQETWHCTPACAAILEKAGVTDICLTIDGDTFVCALPLDVGICMAYGLSEEAALASLTRSPARVLGVENRIGTIEAGKDADLAAFNGFPFRNTTLCQAVMIDGNMFSWEEAY